MATTYFPIKNITTYSSNWTLLAKIVDKSPLKSIRGDKNFLYIDIVDKNGDTIRAKFWDVAATKWNNLLQKGSVYTFSNGSVNLSNKKFNTLPHKYEITFNSESKIEPSNEANDIKLERSYDFVSLRDIKSTSRETPFVVDLLCFARSLSPVVVTNTKFNREIKKRSLYVVDDTSYELEVTLWGDLTELPIFEDILDKPVILSHVTIKDWNGNRTGQTSNFTDIRIANDLSARNRDRLTNLESWYKQALAQNERFKSFNSHGPSSGPENYEFLTIEKVVEKAKGYFTFNCKLRKVYWKNKEGNHKLWYNACPTCSKKVMLEQDSNVSRCIACDDAIVTPVPKYYFSCVFIDFTGQIVASVYGDHGKNLLGFSADELDSMDKDKLKNVMDFEVLHRDYKVSGFFKTRNYNGETRNDFTLTSVKKLDYEKEAEYLLEKMEITYDSVENFLGLKKSDPEKAPKKAKKE